MRIAGDSKGPNSRTGRGRRFAVVTARFNRSVTDALRDACVRTLQAHGAVAFTVAVPGAFELPFAARRLARSKNWDGVIALGCIVRGETPHDRYIAAEVSRGLGQVSLETDVPVIFGVLTTLNERQARARSGAGENNKGTEAALAALEMAEFGQVFPKKGRGHRGRSERGR